MNGSNKIFSVILVSASYLLILGEMGI